MQSIIPCYTNVTAYTHVVISEFHATKYNFVPRKRPKRKILIPTINFTRMQLNALGHTATGTHTHIDPIIIVDVYASAWKRTFVPLFRMKNYPEQKQQFVFGIETSVSDFRNCCAHTMCACATACAYILFSRIGGTINSCWEHSASTAISIRQSGRIRSEVRAFSDS